MNIQCNYNDKFVQKKWINLKYIFLKKQIYNIYSSFLSNKNFSLICSDQITNKSGYFYLISIYK